MKPQININRHKFQIAIGFIIVIIILIVQFKSHNLGKYFYTHDYVRNVFKSLNYNGIIFALKDNETFPLWNKQITENLRNDIKIISIMLLSEKWYIEQIRRSFPKLTINMNLKGKFSKSEIRNIMMSRIINNNIGKHPVYFSNKNEKSTFKNYNFIPTGTVYRISGNKNVKNHPLEYYNFRVTGKNLDNMTKIMFQSYAINLSDCGNYFLPGNIINIAEQCFKLAINFNNLIGLAINNVYNLKNLGIIHLKQGNKNRTTKYWQEAVSLQPNTEFARELKEKINQLLSGGRNDKLYRIAEDYYNRKNFKASLNYYFQILKKYPGEEWIYSNIGDCYFNLKKLDKAIEYYEKAIKINKYYSFAYYNLGGSYYEKGNVRKAVEIWQRGLKLIPDDKRLKRILSQTH